MSVLIDVNNVLHVVGVLPPDLAGIDVEELGDLIQKSRFRRDHVVFVCDGKRRRHMTTPDIKVVFSGAGVSADDVIIGMVDRSTAPRRLTVVSNDREITTAPVAVVRRSFRPNRFSRPSPKTQEPIRSLRSVPDEPRNTGRRTIARSVNG